METQESLNQLLGIYDEAKAAYLDGNEQLLLSLVHSVSIARDQACSVEVLQASYRTYFRIRAFEMFHYLLNARFSQAEAVCRSLLDFRTSRDLMPPTGHRETMIIIYLTGNLHGFSPARFSESVMSTAKLTDTWLELSHDLVPLNDPVSSVLLRIAGEAVAISCIRSGYEGCQSVINRFNNLFACRMNCAPRDYRTLLAGDSRSSHYWCLEKVKAMYQADFRLEELLLLAGNESRTFLESDFGFVDRKYAMHSYYGFTRLIARLFCVDVRDDEEISIPEIIPGLS